MRRWIVSLGFLVASGLAIADGGFAHAQTQTSQQEAFDMEAAEDRWVQIGSRFGLLLIIVLLIKASLDKKKKAAAAHEAAARRPPPRR